MDPTHPGLACPCCQSPMEEHQKEGTTIDVCTECGGLWLDSGELEQILGACPPSQGSASQYRKCPHCLQAMKRVLLGPVGVERCSTCEGYFFDAGELEQLARRRPARAAPAAADPSEAQAVTSFTCQKCKRHLPREKGYAVPGGHVCDSCSGFVSPEATDPGPLGRLLAHFVEAIPTHRRRGLFSLWDRD